MFIILGTFFLLFGFVKSLRDLDTKINIGILKNVPNCKKFVEDNDSIYAWVVARIEGKTIPVYDNTKDDNPTLYLVNNTKFIKGFNLGLLGACEGEKRRITIPPELAYGGESVPGLFEPHSTWVVDAEIIEVVKEVVM